MDPVNTKTQFSVADAQGGSRRRKLAALLCPTPYDPFTRFLGSLFDDFPDLRIPTTLIQVKEPTDYRKLLEAVELGDDTEVVLVFSGHGRDDALLGPPNRHEINAAANAKYSRFYDKEALALGPNVLVAFCCSSGAVLGEFFRTDDTRAFMGFNAPIGFVTERGSYYECWKKILQESTLKIIYCSDPNELREFVRQIYLDAYRYFKSSEGQEHEWWFWMTLLLRGQLDALEIHGRDEGCSQA